MANGRQAVAEKWAQLQDGDAGSALQQLFDNRQKLGSISREQAHNVYRTLGRLQGSVQAWQAGLALLARWASQLKGQNKDQHRPELALLQDIVAAMLCQLPAAPGSIRAAILSFLGAAVAGCPPAMQDECVQAVFAVLEHAHQELLEARAFGDVVQGLQQLSAQLILDHRHAECAWLAACLMMRLEQLLVQQLPVASRVDEERRHSHAAASLSGGVPPPRDWDRHAWLSGQRLIARTVDLCGSLSRLYQLGAGLGRATAQATTTPPFQPVANTTQELPAVVVLLCVGVEQGSCLGSALCGTLAAGMLDGAMSPLSKAASAQTAPSQQQQLQLQQPLLHILDVACARSAGAAGYGPAASVSSAHAGSGAVASLAAGLVGMSCARLHVARAGALASHPPTFAALLCLAHVLTHFALSLSGMFYHAVARTEGASGAPAAHATAQSAGGPSPAPEAPAAGAAVGAPTTAPAAASAPRAAAAANAWLAQHASSVQQEAGPLARMIAGQAAHLTAAEAAGLAAAMRCGAAVLSGGYADYALAVEPQAARQIDGTAVRGVLDKVFASHLVVFMALWQQAGLVQASDAARPAQGGPMAEKLQEAWGSSTAGDLTDQPHQQHAAPAAMGAAAMAQQAHQQHGGVHDVQQQRAVVAAEALAALSLLQFCRPQGLQQYEQLVGALVGEVAASPAAAQTMLQCSLPCYDALVQTVVTSRDEPAATARWQVDSVLAARLGFLVPLLPLAWRTAPDGETAAAAVLPLLLLLLQHPLPALALAAHSAYGSIAAGCGEREGCGASVLERSLPLYLRRALEAYPGPAGLEGLQLGMHYLMPALPADSSAGLLCVRRVAARVLQLLEPSGAGGTAGLAPLAVGSAGVPAASKRHEAAMKLFVLLPQLLLAVDYRLVPSALGPVSEVVRAAPPTVEADMLNSVYHTLLRSEDHTRKSHLLRWLYCISQGAQGDTEAARLQTSRPARAFAESQAGQDVALQGSTP